ncbi:class I SAM-dependent methyltransferase [Kiloniella litopenaei]|uniref:class I SAM-dependent methyltransferase n=1 Tax=Kiloniella litopenaei TaxID=1549748 RepID=UPI003BAA4302
MKVYGKPAAPWLKAKKWFFDEDKMLLEESLKIADIYTQQEKRLHCKNCETPLGPKIFTKHGIDYTICETCSHLNGLHEDSDAFCDAVYGEDQTQIFAAMYSAKDKEAYEQRRDLIYRPKTDFLLNSLRDAGEIPEELLFEDFGAGTGHFVSSLRAAGCKRVRGFEASETQVEAANSLMGQELLISHELDQFIPMIENSKADVLSLVFVLEHIQNPREALAAIQRNPSIRYAFIAVPLFSPTSFIELAFQEFAPRHLTNGHTHLYTKKSLYHVLEEFGLKPQAEWWFGADVIDFYRMIWMKIANTEGAKGAEALWGQMMLPIIDDMQAVMDKAEMPSEIHMLVRAH